ncbi:restriction endonuclease subunit S [Aliarcobacter cryaerophilus]|uniref:restriction endonuclease subunit S n=1 Tax=Aliarcobacter cryaerophilus TaxID=28198 RepID=UPI0011DFA362|nr:restriction endonuclease subunit S [Aliarcobacter cryaerophilus]
MSNVPKLRFKEFSGEWEEKQLGKIATFYNSKRIPLTEIDRIKGEYPYYGASGIIDYVKDYIFDGEYILLGEDGANIVMRNSRLVFLAKGKFWVNNHAHIFQAKDSNSFLCEALERINYTKYNTGTAQPKLNSDVVKKIKLLLPSKQEQEKIASFLTSVDTKIEQLTKKEELLSSYKKGVMQKIFNQEIRFKADDGRAFCEWDEKKLGDLTKIVVGGTPSTTNDEYWTNGTVNWLSSGDINNGIIKKSSKMITELGLLKSSAKLMPKDTVVLAITGATLGRIGYLDIETSGNQSVAGMIPNSKFEAKFLFYTLQKNTNTILSMAGGAAQAGINKATIESLEFSFPCLEEQTKIANFLSSIDSKIEQVQQHLNSTKEFKKALLQQMFV